MKVKTSSATCKGCGAQVHGVACEYCRRVIPERQAIENNKYIVRIFDGTYTDYRELFGEMR
jgi:hypothetical protein